MMLRVTVWCWWCGGVVVGEGGGVPGVGGCSSEVGVGVRGRSKSGGDSRRLAVGVVCE